MQSRFVVVAAPIIERPLRFVKIRPPMDVQTLVPHAPLEAESGVLLAALQERERRLPALPLNSLRSGQPAE